MVVVWGCVWCQTPPQPTTPKLQLNFLDLENFLSKFEVVVVGGGVWHQTPPNTTTPKLQLNFLDLENFLVKVWGGGGVGGVSGARLPHHHP